MLTELVSGPYSLPIEAVGSASLGVLSHLVYFRHGEHHRTAPLYFAMCVVVTMLEISLSYIAEQLSLTSAGTFRRHAITMNMNFLGSLFVSIAMYRLFFHRLHLFPGPRLCALTKLYHTWKVRDSTNHRFLEEMRQAYGDFVRTGPTEITIYHPDAHEDVHSARAVKDFHKSDWYDILLPHIALNTVRNEKEHQRRREFWNPSFSGDVVPKYDVIYAKYIRRLYNIIGKQGRAVNATELLYHWSFDVMGELIFSRDFDTLHQRNPDSKGRKSLQTMRRFMSLLGPFSSTPWLIILGSRVPGMMDAWNKMFTVSKAFMLERLDSGIIKPDVASEVYKELVGRKVLQKEKYNISGDSAAMVIATAESTGPTLIWALTRLAEDPLRQARLFDELQKAGVKNAFEAKEVINLPYLCAFINEVFRLNPAIPTGTSRLTGAAGAVVGGTFIPPWTKVVTPRYSIARSPQSFSNPNDFIPERWMDDSGLRIHNTNAFSPFGTGPYACIGKTLAIRQIKIFLATMVARYEIQFGEGEDGKPALEGFKDHFTSCPGPVYLHFCPRS